MNRAYTNVLSGLLFLFALTMVPAAVIAHEGDHHDKQATLAILNKLGPSAEARQSRGRHLIILNRSGHSLTEKTPPE